MSHPGARARTRGRAGARRGGRVIATLALGLALIRNGPLLAQSPGAVQSQAPPGLTASFRAERTSDAFTLTYFNRPIVVFRASVLGRGPFERSVGARRILDDIVDRSGAGPVDAQPIDGGSLIRVNSRAVFGVATADVDDLAGETLDAVTARTVANLQQALAEATEARRPALLLGAAALSGVALAIAFLALWGIARLRRAVTDRLHTVSQRTLAQSGIADSGVLRTSRLLDLQRGLVTTVAGAFNLIVLYGTATFILREFPYTRPWGESMSGFLLTSAVNLALGMVRAVPGLFTVFLIFLVTRFVVRIVGMWFTAIEQGRARGRWIHPETAQPTRRILSTLLWVFAVVAAYPYLPGSSSDAFKGVSVFLGLMLTIGSSGLVNQIMSGYMLIYSRALRRGDFVRIGDVEGTVTNLGVLSTKVLTLWQEEVTIPNAVVVAQTTTDYSRLGDVEGVFTPIAVTIGYDAPWRQVHALLLSAAGRTSGLRREPAPMVLQTALEDFYVKYTLLVCLERQQTRPFTLDALHAHIQDLFNEHGVQIMSPNYVFDPASPKVVPKENWFAAPARSDPAAHPFQT